MAKAKGIASKTAAFSKTATFHADAQGKAVREAHVFYRAARGIVQSRAGKHTGILISKTSNTDWVPGPKQGDDRPTINQAALALLRSWRNEDPEEHRAVWETLKQTFDEDRLSDRERIR